MNERPMTIRAVFFDYGGVIQRTEFQSPRQKLAERFRLEYEDMDKIVFDSPTAKQATVGEIPAEKHWEAVARHLKVGRDEIAEVEREFFAGDVVDHSIVKYLRSLRPRFKVGLISNAWSDMRDYLIRRKLDEIFDTLSISAEIGAAKPGAEIYLHALEQAQVGAEAAVFVDDMPANIKACEMLGMKGILFNDPQEAMGRLKNLLGA